ncbi:MAG: hypothetical protein KGK02_07880 [Rhodospirillales bacterium]|nr:hypothetical protein [Rhodospirillales bacterium]
MPKIARSILAICAACAVSAGGAAAQELTIPPPVWPHLPVHAASAAGFVPKGWALEAKIQGDLNGDGVPDLMLVLRDQSPKNIIPNPDGFGEDPLDSNPRILLMALGGKDGYRLIASNHDLITRHTDPDMEDPFDADGGLLFKNGALQVDVSSFYDAGSWQTEDVTFTFRYRHGLVVLAGYDSTTVSRNTGEMDGVSADYLTGRVKTTKGWINNNQETVSWSRLKPHALLQLPSLGDGLLFDPLAERFDAPS